MYPTLVACLLTTIVSSTTVPPSPAAPSDTTAILATVSAFHAALAAGDSIAALALLAPDAIVLEAGELETRSEYAAHHLGADIAFSRAVPSQQLSTLVSRDKDVAWVATITTARGTFHDRPIASQGAELMVLSHTSDGWRIRAIHWSSQRL